MPDVDVRIRVHARTQNISQLCVGWDGVGGPALDQDWSAQVNNLKTNTLKSRVDPRIELKP